MSKTRRKDLFQKNNDNSLSLNGQLKALAWADYLKRKQKNKSLCNKSLLNRFVEFYAVGSIGLNKGLNKVNVLGNSALLQAITLKTRIVSKFSSCCPWHITYLIQRIAIAVTYLIEITFAISKFVYGAIYDEYRKLSTLAGMFNHLLKIFLNTLFMNEIGTGSKGKRWGNWNIELHIFWIKVIVNCILTVKNRKPFVSYGWLAFLLIQGYFYFLREGGERAITALLTMIDPVLSFALLIHVLDTLIVKSVLNRTFQQSIEYCFKILGLDKIVNAAAALEDSIRVVVRKTAN